MNAASHIKETTLGQRLAADPALSAIVSANAGAGKTRVLTNRVARLLLAGEEPARILCITFTKAAAAEMAQRLFDLLGKWALSPNEKLQKDLASLDGDDRIRSPEELANARRLFARALETPGGLKIQTIHSFCESLLKRFPLEAGIAPGFSVIEDAEAALAAKTAVASVAGRADGAIKAAFERLLQSMNGGALKDLLEANVISRRPFARATEFGWDAFKNEAAEILGTTPGDESDEIASSLVAALQDHDLKRALDALDQSGGNPQKLCAKPLQTYLSSQSIETKLAALARLFRKSDGAPRESFGTKKTEEIDPGVEAILRDAQQVYLGYADRIRGADAYHDSAAFYDIVRAGLEQYESAKAARGALDFDDLILYSRRLLSNANDTQWVLYKLDAGIRHILLDEAQDTGPDSWDVIERPLEEFFSGETARKGGRTFFAVGDMKQSIYSFQGADAALFGEKQEALGKRIAAVSKYEAVTLRASFRTTDPVLRFVDELFRREEVVDNVSLETPLRHLCTRDGAAGMVELWPLVERIPAEDGNPWDAPLDATAPDSPPRKLAMEIAETISGWLKREEILESKGRPIKPGDIMILVQSRKALFREIIRALGKKGVPVAGADKIALLEDQGVLDLISYARCALTKNDDLSLAETLKSPFFNLDDDGLYTLAANRPGTLWRSLEGRVAEQPQWRIAYEEISAARRIAKAGGAVAFFTHILETGTPSGWRRLTARLGTPAREPIEELLSQALDFELRNPRSLRLFLNHLARTAGEISRESAEESDVVRVMTAHKAKGLEANIVFIADAHRQTQTGAQNQIIPLENEAGEKIPILAIGDIRRHPIIEKARENTARLAHDEYRRLLYVAATRARDRLYICGCETGNNKNPHNKEIAKKTWHALAEDAFGDFRGVIEQGGEKWGRPVLRLRSKQSAPAKDSVNAAPSIEIDDWNFLHEMAPIEERAQKFAPSRLGGAEESAAYSPARRKLALKRGKLLHKLLELLPNVTESAREEAAARYIKQHGDDFTAEELNEIKNEALAVIADPRFAAVFAEGSLAEVSIGGVASGAGAALSGQIDRLAVLEDRILVVDYKSNRPPPKRVEETPRSYLAQMAAYRALLRDIYPGRRIEMALLWTYDARLMPLTDAVLNDAFPLTLA